MDPQACLDRLMRALRERDNEEAVQASSDLLCWLLAGGFVPRNNSGTRAEISVGLARVADLIAGTTAEEEEN